MSFADLVQHKEVATQLHRSLQRGRLAHAYLLTGPRHAGKEDVAVTLAQALNCLKKTNDACGACAACRLIAERKFPDVHWVRPASKTRRISVEQIRELEKALHLKAGNARIKLGIIADAECLGEEASNAFLKTLEEPPAQTILLLLASEPQRLLPTILSRCLRLRLGAEERGASPYRARVVAVLTEFTQAGDRGVPAVYRLHGALLGLLQSIREEIQQAAEAEADLDRLAELEPKARERLEKELEARIEGEYRGRREQVLEELYAWFGDVLLGTTTNDPALVEHGEQWPVLERAARVTSAGRALDQLDAIEQIRLGWARNIAEGLALEVGLLKLVG